MYYLNCSELKSVSIPEPTLEPAPEAVEMAESSEQQCDMTDSSDVMVDKCAESKTDEEGSFKLAGV